MARPPRGLGYSPRIDAKRFTGPDHPDRDLQLVDIQDWIAIFTGRGRPIIGVDAEKKRLIGNLKDPGAVWRLEPEEVNVHDLLEDAECRATPYGVDDMVSGPGHVRVGTPADTPAFAVEAAGSWWARYGRGRYRGTGELLIPADGASDGHRPRLRKARLRERIADRHGPHATVRRYPAGASRWSPVERRLLAPVSIDWAGQPSRALEARLGRARGAEVGGAGVTAALDRATYPTRVEAPKDEMRRLESGRHGACPAWSHTIGPRRPQVLD